MSAESKRPLIVRRLKWNIARGKLAREELGEKLAEMSPVEMAKLPRATLERFAPDALLSLAKAAAKTDDILPASQDTVPMESRAARKSALPLWALSAARIAAALVLALIAGTLDRPARWTLARVGVLTPAQTDLCARLDRWTDLCAYEMRQAELTLEEASSLLAMPVELLAMENPSLPLGIPLPANTVLKINRNNRR